MGALDLVETLGASDGQHRRHLREPPALGTVQGDRFEATGGRAPLRGREVEKPGLPGDVEAALVPDEVRRRTRQAIGRVENSHVAAIYFSRQ